MTEDTNKEDPETMPSEDAVAVEQGEDASAPTSEEIEENAPGTSTDDPLARVEFLEAETEQLRDQLLRLRAEFDNYRKRVAREKEQLRKRAASELIGDLLPVIDNMERALHFSEEAAGPLTEGVEMVQKQMADLLDKAGVKAIPIDGASFDPAYHEAIAQIPSEDVPQGMITEEFQRGYTLHGEVLRPTKVTVSSGPPEAQPETDASESS